MIKGLGWKHLIDTGMLFNMILNHKVNVLSERIKPVKGKTRTSVTHNRFMHTTLCNIDDYKVSFYPQTIPQWNQRPSTTINIASVET